MNRDIQTRVSVPGNEKVRGQQAHAQACLSWNRGKLWLSCELHFMQRWVAVNII